MKRKYIVSIYKGPKRIDDEIISSSTNAAVSLLIKKHKLGKRSDFTLIRKVLGGGETTVTYANKDDTIGIDLFWFT